MPSLLNPSEIESLKQAANRVSKIEDHHLDAKDLKFPNHKSSVLSKDQMELLNIHNRFNHQLPIKEIQILAEVGYFPKRLALCRYPQCCACQFRKAQK